MAMKLNHTMALLKGNDKNTIYIAAGERKISEGADGKEAELRKQLASYELKVGKETNLTETHMAKLVVCEYFGEKTSPVENSPNYTAI